MSHRVCECCGRIMTSIPVDQLDLLDELPKQRRHQEILDQLIMAYPRWVERAVVVDGVFGDRGVRENTFNVHMSRLRKIVATTEWRIENKWGFGYRLRRSSPVGQWSGEGTAADGSGVSLGTEPG